MMTYQDSISNFYRLKDFIGLYDDSAWIYFIFTTDSEFTLEVYTSPDYATRRSLQKRGLGKPMACVNVKENRQVFSYWDTNLAIEIDQNTNDVIEFECDIGSRENFREQARREYKKLINKLK